MFLCVSRTSHMSLFFKNVLVFKWEVDGCFHRKLHVQSSYKPIVFH